MHFTRAIGVYLSALAAATSASSVTDPPVFPPPTLPPVFPPPTLPPTLTPVFTLSIRANDFQTPIPRLLGGYQAVYPLVDGTISGSALSGTIHHGLGAPHVTDDGNYAFSIRGYYGSTTDGEDFYIEQRGVGLYTREQTWMHVTIGGQYAYLQHVFLLAQNDVDTQTHSGNVTVYAVNLQDQQ